jgi:cytoskeletal protein RodZ
MSRIRLVLLFVLVAWCMAALPASAQTPSPTATPAAGGQGSGDGNDGEIVAIAILVLGAGGAALSYLFYDRWRLSYEKLASETLSKTGRFPTTEFDPVASSQFRARGVGAGEAVEQPKVTGPIAIAVGRAAAYNATVDGQPAGGTAWAVEPADSASVDPATGAETSVTAKKEGPLTLTAKLGEGQPTLVHVTALADRQSGGVPLLGTSWAGVTAVIIAFAIAGALTALGKLDGDAFIAFLGPVVGYFFAATRGSTQGGGAGGTDSGGAAAPTT